MRRLVWSDHAVFQLKERKLSKQTVVAAFRKPDRIVSQTGHRRQLLKLISRWGKQYLLIVIFDREKRADTIITVIITSKIKKYLS